MGSNVRFHGSLKSKNRSDLKDILAALSLNAADLTYNKDYLQRIEDHFNEHPHLKQDIRFWGLFHKGNPPAAPIPSSLSSAESDIISQPSQSGSDPSYTASQYSLPPSANTAQSFAIDPRLYQQAFNNNYDTATHPYYPHIIGHINLNNRFILIVYRNYSEMNLIVVLTLVSLTQTECRSGCENAGVTYRDKILQDTSDSRVFEVVSSVSARYSYLSP